jgi:hypothetical protein
VTTVTTVTDGSTPATASPGDTATASSDPAAAASDAAATAGSDATTMAAATTPGTPTSPSAEGGPPGNNLTETGAALPALSTGPMIAAAATPAGSQWRQGQLTAGVATWHSGSSGLRARLGKVLAQVRGIARHPKRFILKLKHLPAPGPDPGPTPGPVPLPPPASQLGGTAVSAASAGHNKGAAPLAIMAATLLFMTLRSRAAASTSRAGARARSVKPLVSPG